MGTSRARPGDRPCVPLKRVADDACAGAGRRQDDGRDLSRKPECNTLACGVCEYFCVWPRIFVCGPNVEQDREYTKSKSVPKRRGGGGGFIDCL